MTTIAFRDGVIAADSAVTCDGEACGAVAHPKFHLINPGAVVAVAGDVAMLAKIIDAAHVVKFNNRAFKASIVELVTLAQLKKEDEFIAMFILRSGKAFKVFELTDSLYPYELVRPFYAIGSGAAYAMGAMAAGAGAAQAVTIAKKYDTATGGNIVSYNMTRTK